MTDLSRLERMDTIAMRDLYSNDVDTAARLARDDDMPEVPEFDYDEGGAVLIDSVKLPVCPADFTRHFGSQYCGRCDALISQADDGAWEDSSGACGCGDDEHYPALDNDDLPF